MPTKFLQLKDKSPLAPLKKARRKALITANDDYWNALAERATHWAIIKEEETIGYALVNAENQLIQFFLLPLWLRDGVAIFKQFIEQQEIKTALICTNAPSTLAIAMHLQQSAVIDSYLFTDFVAVEVKKQAGNFRAATAEDLARIVEFSHLALGADKEWLTAYTNRWIKRGDFFLLENEAEILGVCEVRTNDLIPGVAYLGMIVSSKYRKKGLGTYLLGKAKEIANQRNKQAICSCGMDNIGSIKSIQNNGFRIAHLQLLLTF